MGMVGEILNELVVVDSLELVEAEAVDVEVLDEERRDSRWKALAAPTER